MSHLDFLDEPIGPRPGQGLVPDDLAAWLAANPGASEEDRRAAFERSRLAAAARLEAYFANWMAEIRASKASGRAA